LRELAFLQTKEVLGEVPEGDSADLQLLFVALGDPKSEYWASARKFRETYANQGTPIILVKPLSNRGKTGAGVRR